MAAFTVVPRHVLGGPKFIAPSEKLNIAGVGLGARSEVAAVVAQHLAS